MADYVIEVLDANASRVTLERIIRQKEQLDLELVTLDAGIVQGRRANVLTLARSTASGQVSLDEVDGSLDAPGQTTELNTKASGRRVVCYGAAYLGSTLENVAAFRG